MPTRFFAPRGQGRAVVHFSNCEVQLLIQGNYKIQKIHRVNIQLIAKVDVRPDAAQICLRRDFSQDPTNLRYEYVALIDHSPAARVARGLSEERLEEKFEAVERIRRQRGAHKPRILVGAEVDIISDGTLDYDDKILRRLDVVVASVHTGFRQGRDRITGRLLDAISNPYVQILGHPTTRIIGRREGVSFDFDRILKAVIEASVAFEIDSQTRSSRPHRHTCQSCE